MPSAESVRVQRAYDVCRKVAFGKEILDFDLNTICASLGVDRDVLLQRMKSDGFSVVQYVVPEYRAYQVGTRLDAVRRAAFRARTRI